MTTDSIGTPDPGVARERLTVSPADVERMTASVFIDGPVAGRQSSRFWVLLVLAGVIATAGVVADSTATVIGAMIVAPLMSPILGVALAVVLACETYVSVRGADAQRRVFPEPKSCFSCTADIGRC